MWRQKGENEGTKKRYNQVRINLAEGGQDIVEIK
jgi:hypothetical protein